MASKWIGQGGAGARQRAAWCPQRARRLRTAASGRATAGVLWTSAALLGAVGLGSAWFHSSAGAVDSASTAAVAGMRTLDCQDGATRRGPHGGEVVNNTWNRKAAGRFAAEQCIVERDRTTTPAASAGIAAPPTEMGWRWKWPSRGALYAYPSVRVGATPWHDGPGNDARFPRRIADIRSMPLRYDMEVQSSGKFNVTAEMWIVDKPAISSPPDLSAIRTELMIWTDASPGVAEAGTMPRIGHVRLEGRDWDIYGQKDWGANTGAPNRWTFVIYMARIPTRAISYDLKAFLDDAIGRGLVAREHYVADVELGNEIVSGTGVTWIRDFQLSVN